MGAITAVWVGTTWAGMPGIPHAFLAIVLAMLAGALWAGIAGILKATVGAHEVITTIMLNWIAYWVGSYLVRARRAAAERRERVGADLERHRPERQAARLVGERGAARAAHRVLHRDRGARRVLVHPQPDDARLRGARGRLQPGGRALRGDQRRAELLPRDGDRRQLRGARRRARHPRLAVPARLARHPDVADRLHRHRGRAARAQHGDRRRPLRAPVRRAALRDVDAEPRPRGLPAGARRQPDADDPGARPAVRRRRRARRLRLEPASEAPSTRRRARGGSRDDRGRRRRPRESILDRLPRGNRAVAWVGVLLGLLAFFVGAPADRGGLAGLADPVRAARRSRPGSGRSRAASVGSRGAAIVLGVVGIGLGYLATLSARREARRGS